METAKIGGTPKGGICRLTLTELDREVRDWLRVRAEALGCAVTIDDMGNMFARRAGQRADVPPIAMGSHLDTQPTGGKFDGALGVLAALEALRTLERAGYQTFAPVEVINWTNEEGARFTPAMIASGVFAGVFERDWAAFGVFRTTHRARPLSRSRGQGHRRRHRRSGHALVRSDGDRPGQPRRHDADAAPPRCAACRRAAGGGR
jgi:acetylornithine deacetylase/succinyl-diaminopimelate desuccinylase-like protein